MFGHNLITFSILLASRSYNSEICMLTVGESRPLKGAVGTYNYMAPEVYDSNYGPSADIWSLGVIGFALLCSFLPFTADSDEVNYN
jgi:serine/threonine protein kinase